MLTFKAWCGAELTKSDVLCANKRWVKCVPCIEARKRELPKLAAAHAKRVRIARSKGLPTGIAIGCVLFVLGISGCAADMPPTVVHVAVADGAWMPSTRLGADPCRGRPAPRYTGADPAATVAGLRRWFERYQVAFSVELPAVPHVTLVLSSGDSSWCTGVANFAGMAPLNGDPVLSDAAAYLFGAGWPTKDARDGAHELGHMLGGLEHSSDEHAVMFPIARDESVENFSEVTAPTLGRQFRATQNEHAALLAALGPS